MSETGSAGGGAGEFVDFDGAMERCRPRLTGLLRSRRVANGDDDLLRDFGDLYPVPGSPLIDAGSPEDAPSGDHAGAPRPMGRGVDIGVVEFFADCDGDGVSDNEEIAEGSELDCNSNGLPDTCDLASGVLHDADEDGVIDECVPPMRFLRGDVNQDASVDISDSLAILEWRFLGRRAPDCLAAADANGDRSVNLADSVVILYHLFLGREPPAAPFPECGESESESDASSGCDVPSCE